MSVPIVCHGIIENFFEKLFSKGRNYQRDYQVSLQQKYCKQKLIHSPQTASGVKNDQNFNSETNVI